MKTKAVINMAENTAFQRLMYFIRLSKLYRNGMMKEAIFRKKYNDIMFFECLTIGLLLFFRVIFVKVLNFDKDVETYYILKYLKGTNNMPKHSPSSFPKCLWCTL